MSKTTAKVLSPKKKKRSKERKEVWIIAGRDQFAKYGLKGINVDDLSKNVGISRTSFYHFFKTKDQFLKEMTNYWIQDGTVRIIESTMDIKDPKARMQKIFDLALHNNMNDKFLAQLRYVAPQNSFLKKKMSEAEALRIKTLTKLFSELDQKTEKSGEYAHLIYMLFLGFGEYHKVEGYREETIQRFINMVMSNLLE
jgi:AcrR family transcriptional regulator